MAEKVRTDRVEMQGGVVHLPAEFREVARLANAAGLEGLEFVDAEFGLDVAAAMAGDGFPPSRILLTYKPRESDLGKLIDQLTMNGLRDLAWKIFTCADSSGAYLIGGATIHKPGCALMAELQEVFNAHS